MSRMPAPGCQPLAHRLGRDLPGIMPPIKEGSLVARGPACHAHPGKDLEPDVPREGTPKEEMAHCFRLLAAKRATVVVLQSMPGEAVRHPTSVQADKPEEELHSGGCPTLPCEPPVAAGHRAVEGSGVCRFSGVDARHRPLPHELVRRVVERCVRLISPPMGPTAHWALDPCPDRGRPAQARLVGPCHAVL